MDETPNASLGLRRLDDYFARVCNAVEFADEHLGEDLSLARLAEVACFSPRHFHRVFTSLLGETPDDCVRRLRLQKAAGLILALDPPSMTQVAMDCGFSTSALFSRNFARHFGKSPTEWRDGMKRQGKVKHRQTLVASGKDGSPSFRYLVGEEDVEVGIDVLRIPPFTVYCVPYLQGYDEGVSIAYARLIRWARPRGLLSEGSRKVSIPFDNPSVSPPQRCRNYAGIAPGPSMREPEGGATGLVRTMELGGTFLRASYDGPGRGLHAVYRLVYEVAIPELGYASFGGRGFIEYPEALDPRRLDPCRMPGGPTLVHVPVRPGLSP